MKRYIKTLVPAAALLMAVGTTSCTNDLDVTPIDPNKNTELNVSSLFNMCYANFGLEGDGPGNANIAAEDPGTAGLIRQYWNMNELGTDEAICAWTDPGVTTLNTNQQDASNMMVSIFYNRLYYGISVCNQYLDVASGVDATQTAEIRLLRAIQYYLAMDVFGNIPLATTISPAMPEQKTQAEMYAWLENEVLELEPNLSEPKAKTSADANYGRVDKAAAWMLLSRLYLNAEVYTGTAQWEKAAQYAKKVIESDYHLFTTGTGAYSSYAQLFMGNNGENGSSVEAVFPILQQGSTTASYGGSFFLMASCWKDDMVSNGTNGNWQGNRARPELVRQFFPNNDAPNETSANMTVAAGDDRALFWGQDRTLQIETITDFVQGFSVTKFNNVYSDGGTPTRTDFADTDFFFFRVGEAYLTYAEAMARLNGGTAPEDAVSLLNQLRMRAHAGTKSAYTLQDILDERSRELYFEGLRRTDLIRYGKFGGESADYVWSWKGGSANGVNFKKEYNLMPLPSSDLSVNANLKQNAGY